MTQLLSLVCCLGLPHPSIPPQTLLLYCNMVYRQACECLTHSWEVYLKINKNYNNPTLHHKKNLLSLAHWAQKTKELTWSFKESCQTICPHLPRQKLKQFSPNLVSSQSPDGSAAHTASSQTPEYLLHDKKCCNSVRAILPTLGSKNAKQESPL